MGENSRIGMWVQWQNITQNIDQKTKQLLGAGCYIENSFDQLRLQCGWRNTTVFEKPHGKIPAKLFSPSP
jgi:hypothetical protein